MTTTGAATDTAGTSVPPTRGANDLATVEPERDASAEPTSAGPGRPVAAPVGGGPPPWQRLRDLPRRLYATAQAEAVLITVLVGSFVARLLLADRNSYWLDELYSVAIYGIWNDSARAAVDHLATTSVHPPVYQFILYNWMEIFGDAERSTRALSNLYIALATLFLYLLLRGVFAKRVALGSAIVFALMYTPTYYALETRSYAQTIFLVTLSSFALHRIMRLGAEVGWRRALVSPTALVFTGANLALLLTHYYNAFFWVAQAVIAGCFVLRQQSWRRWPAGLAAVAGMYGLQGGVFALVWGRVLLDDYRRRGDAFPVEGGVRSPFDLFRSVLEPNLDPPTVITVIGIALFAVFAIRSLLGLARRSELTQARQRDWTAFYLLCWVLVPLLVVYAAFMLTGVARYSTRYWLFILPPLAPLLVLAVEEAYHLAGRAWHRIWRRDLSAGWAVLAMTATVATLIFPGTIAAASRTKTDWRSAAEDIVTIVEADPDSRYLIYETSFRSTPVLDYYLARYSDDIRVDATLPRSQERRGEFTFESGAEEIAEHDFLLVAFIHHETDDFPTAIERLEETYPVHHSQIDHRGRGLLIFDVAPESRTGTDPEASR